MNIPAVSFWALIALGLVWRGPALIYIFFAALPFETLAVVPPELVSGVTLTPGWVAGGFLALKMILAQPRLGSALAPLVDVRRIGLLSACALYGAISALLLPRLFQGMAIYPMRPAFVGPASLGPSPANFTQTFYFLLTALAVLAFYLAGRDERFRKHVLNAILFGGLVAILTGLADMLTAASGTSAVLAPLRTATYALLTDAEVLSTKRVVGLMPEASAYAALCMTLAAPIFFLSGTYQTGLTRKIVAPAIFLMLLVMVTLSTSSTGYIGLAVLFATIVLYGGAQLLRGRKSGLKGLAFAYLAATAAVGILAFFPDVLLRPLDFVNRMVFQKTLSPSYLERSQWNQLALQDFHDTFGLGAGLGSVRASSWPVAILGNIGFVGAALMAAFLAVVVLGRPASPGADDAELATGAKFALIPILVMASLSATSVGFGLMPACLFGVIGAVVWPRAQASARGATPARSRRAPARDLQGENP